MFDAYLIYDVYLYDFLCLYDMDVFTCDIFMDAIHILNVCSRFYGYDNLDYVLIYAMHVYVFMIYVWNDDAML